MHRESSSVRGWTTVAVAAVLMLATLPGRTQGLGLITEPLLRDLRLDRVAYAHINLWATLGGAVICIPFGSLLDRFGLRWITAAVVFLLALVVWGMSAQSGSVVTLFLLVLATRALGQSALSVASITAVGKSFDRTAGMAMGVYSVLLSVFFAIAFVVVGGLVSSSGWRTAWLAVAVFLLVVVLPLTIGFLRVAPTTGETTAGAFASRKASTLALMDALRTPAFWIFAGSASLFGLVSSGLGLFNEAVLAERGFSQETYHTFLAATAIIALAGQGLCGWLTTRWSMQTLLGVAMLLYAVGLAGFPFLKTMTHLWMLAALSGIAGGLITVLFFAIWGEAFGRTNLGWIQGAAQMLTVLASAIGPLVFATCAQWYGSYTPALWSLAPLVLVFALASFRVTLPNPVVAASPLTEIA